MRITHISAECYPIAKVGGLADVVGALPKYQNQNGIKSDVIMPFYDTNFTKDNTFEKVYSGVLKLGFIDYEYEILKTNTSSLEFDVYFIKEPLHLFKPYVYSEEDTDRFLIFQIAALDWILSLTEQPDYIHCHDHHTGLIPFMLQESYKYNALNKIPVITTIHNAQYQGWMSYDNLYKIPDFNSDKMGLLDWDGVINPLAAAIKCAWRVTTVSPNYMEELKKNANGLEQLLSQEAAKCVGVLNGIDTEVWNPETDTFIIENFNLKTIASGKSKNKEYLCNTFGLDSNKPLFAFIGRLVGEKGADVLPHVFDVALRENDINILLLGSGHKDTELHLNGLKDTHSKSYNNYIGYDEKLSHIIYAGADFLLMPSRVEPCGLNQMYALRYGTVPVVRATGGLKDTVIDINETDGFGICHNNVLINDMLEAIKRATAFYSETDRFIKNRMQIMQIDHSWEASANTYLKIYQSINKNND